MASTLSYNGVLLHLTRTNSYSQEPILSPDRSDYLGTRITIDLDAVYNPGCSGGTGPATDVAVRAALMAPRGELIYVIGGTTVLRSPAVGFGTDIENGPTPLGCTVRGLTERTWRVNFRVTTAINACASSASGLLSNRWQQTHAIGGDHLTTIVTRGASIFRMDALTNLNENADAFRHLCLPLTPLHFQRRSIVVRVNELGNALAWECVDQERFVSLGATLACQRYGVVDFDAVHTIGSIPAGAGGIASESTIHSIQVQAIGDRNSNRADLLTWAAKLAIEKLALPMPGVPVKPKDEAIITNVLFSEKLDTPIVTCSIAARRNPQRENAKQGAGPLLLSLMGLDASLFDPNGQNPNMPNGVRGTYTGEAFAAALKSACASPSMPTAAVPGQVSDPDDFLDNTAQTLVDICVTGSSDGQGLEEGTNLYSEEAADDGAVTEARVEVSWEKSQGTLSCPVAGTGTEPPVLLALANPICYRVARWSVERAVDRPMIPAPESFDLSEVLVGDPVIVFAAPELAPDGATPMYRASGEYRYLRKDNRGPGDDNLWMGAVPWASMLYTDATNKAASADYRHGITDPEDYTA